MARKKKLLIWGSVFSFIVAAFSVYCVVSLAYNINGLYDYMKEFISEYYEVEADVTLNVLNMTKTYFIVDAVCNAVFGVVYVIYSNLPLAKFNNYKRVIMMLTIAGVLLGLNIITLILVLFAIFSETHEELEPQVVIDNAKTPNDSDKFYELAAKITELKNKLQNNEITEEQYKTELSKLIGEQAKEN